MKGIKLKWSERKQKLRLSSPPMIGREFDEDFLSQLFSQSVLDELERRGYDIKTLEFTICPKQGNLRFASTRPDGMTKEHAEKCVQGEPLTQTKEQPHGIYSHPECPFQYCDQAPPGCRSLGYCRHRPPRNTTTGGQNG